MRDEIQKTAGYSKVWLLNAVVEPIHIQILGVAYSWQSKYKIYFVIPKNIHHILW